MIASLRGTVIHINLTSAVIECAGVGYLVMATPATLGQLRRGEEATLLTLMVVREDAMTLYGFDQADARDMFVTLQTVSGLGPRLAMAALSVYTPQDIAAAISGGDHKALQKIPGVGKRMAERMVVDLKDKVADYGVVQDTTQGVDLINGAVAEQVSEALQGLGFTAAQADQAVATVLKATPDADTQSALRLALAHLGSKK
ncbi:Holliday junction branch migration protein RuvA [Corynebacterium sp. 13CS0277]|uniref:Holliday junction branch migration protein RuvA n=1 Tax=Corynebacterium sp. 13CS0277 TaxID=2071994 RepID=UPI000D0253C4|nr:Holliday junction branch migration protein RuvA [Corynebacterium sp. 13CS0277]PRQ11979.1 Holliday junction branch migration protein RuvA [Corynebacterium sp. 13CS0277]